MLDFEATEEEFSAALRFYQQATRKTGVDVVNRAGRNLAFTMMRELPAAQLTDFTKYNPLKKRGAKFSNRLHYAKNAKKTPKGSGIKSKAEEDFKKAKRSRNYLKAFFLKIAQDMGGRAKEPYAGGGPSRSKAKQATEVNPQAYLKTGNMERGALDIIKKYIPRARRKVIDDMVQYARKKMAKDAEKYSA